MLQSETRIVITSIKESNTFFYFKGYICRGKEKVVPMHTIKGYEGVEVLLHLLGNSAADVGSHPSCFTLAESTHSQCPLNQRLGGPQSLTGCSGEQKNLLLLPGIKPQLLVSIYIES